MKLNDDFQELGFDGLEKWVDESGNKVWKQVYNQYQDLFCVCQFNFIFDSFVFHRITWG